MTTDPGPGDIPPLEQAKLDLEHARLRRDTLKWVAIAIGAVASFWIIDYGTLRVEKFRANAENERELLASYLDATDSAHPDIWIRKLTLLHRLTKDPKLKAWAKSEQEYIENYAALQAFYREALTTASQLVDPGRLNVPARAQARERFEQLYWADLPFAGESPDVAGAMVQFRNALIQAETTGSWSGLNGKLIELSHHLSVASKDLKETRKSVDDSDGS